MNEKDKTLNNNVSDKSISCENVDLIKAYIGENSDRILAGKLNLPTILVGNLYFYYRKMYGYGFLAFVVEAVIIFRIMSISGTMELTNALIVIEIIGYNVILMLISNKLYLRFVKYNIKELIRKNPQMSYEEMKTLCSKKGNIDMDKTVGFAVLEIVIAVVAFYLLIVLFLHIIAGAFSGISG